MSGDIVTTEPTKALLYGLPVLITEDGGCSPANAVSGLFLDVMCSLFGFNGWVMPYEGAYLPALWRWLTQKPDGDDEGDPA